MILKVPPKPDCESVGFSQVLNSAPAMGLPWVYRQTGEGEAGEQCHGKGPG